MFFQKSRFLSALICAIIAVLFTAVPANAAGGIVDAFNLAPFVPIVLDTMMGIATGGYEFFVGNGDGIIYIFVWGFLAFTLVMYVFKMYIPKAWAGFMGFSGGGELADGKVTAMSMAENMLKPAMRAIIAVTLLLQIKPVYVTQWLVNPFLEFGAIYTHSITENIDNTGDAAPVIKCPESILEKAWISEDSCNFLTQPVADISHANNRVIKRGLEFLTNGLRGLMTLMPHGGENFLNVLTGIVLVITFVGSNLFMALLIIQAIFGFGMSLVLYPFQVLTYVAKSSDKWLDIWPAFSGIVKALQSLVITMIACAFILCINLAIVKSLFRWSSSAFVAAADGAATSNIPTMTNTALGFGEHSVLWLSGILTFYLMFRIFDLTREQLTKYTSGVPDSLYKKVTGDTKSLWNTGNKIRNSIKTAKDLFKKK